MRIFLRGLARQFLPAAVASRIKAFEYWARKSIAKRRAPLTAQDLDQILTRLNVRVGDVVMVHASLDMLHTSLSRRDVIERIQSAIGPTGTLVVPTFPRIPSTDWMRSDEVFDVRKTPSGMGAISESVRRMPSSRRSLHPTKSIAAVGPLADALTRGHETSPLPFGQGSPFQRLVEANAKVLGIGVPMSYLSLVHVVEDCHPHEFPLRVNEPIALRKRCRDRDGSEIIVESFVHDMQVVAKANPEKFIRRYVNSSKVRNFKCFSTPFFSVESAALYEALVREMKRKITIYS
jgi:aminoglycoside 3-N-acetyltransferase